MKEVEGECMWWSRVCVSVCAVKREVIVDFFYLPHKIFSYTYSALFLNDIVRILELDGDGGVYAIISCTPTPIG